MHYDVSQLHHQYILLSWIPLVAAQSIHLAHYVDSDGVIREAFKNKNDETYGIFHMLVDPPPCQHMENSFVIFLLSKKDF